MYNKLWGMVLIKGSELNRGLNFLMMLFSYRCNLYVKC